MQLFLCVSAPESKLKEWCFAVMSRIRHIEDQGESSLFKCAPDDVDLAVRMAKACDVTIQQLTCGPWSYGPLAVQHEEIFTVAKNSWEKYEMLHLGSDRWHWGHINDCNVGTVRPGAAAETQGGNGARPRNGGIESTHSPGKPVQN